MDEWNFTLFYEAFLDLFENHSLVIDDAELRRYSKNWHRPAVAKDLEKYDLRDDEDGAVMGEEADFAAKAGNSEDSIDETGNAAVSKVAPIFQPRGVQIEALYALENSRAEGAVKGLVQAATGDGGIIVSSQAKTA